jgi:hypothetical protein
MADYRAPTGAEIKGTLEKLLGVALINGIDDNGLPEFAGETEVDWDSQETCTRLGKVLYVDTNGEEWTFNQLTKVEE